MLVHILNVKCQKKKSKNAADSNYVRRSSDTHSVEVDLSHKHTFSIRRVEVKHWCKLPALTLSN